MRNRTRISSKAKSDINVTPLIDVLLVLIVMFMVITPVTPKGLPTEVPQPAPLNSPESPKNTLVLSLDRNGDIRLNRERLDLTMVVPRLREVFSARADRTLFVQADDEALFNEVAGIIDMARGAGADRVGLLTKQLER
jgi:biopolymer transport protein TolR